MIGQNPTRLAIIYASAVTALFIFVEATHARQKTDTFDEITVHRINVTEPDGKVRLVISNRARLPGVMVKGKEGKPNRPYAGMIFYNDEETENGGLIFAGHQNANGEVESSGVSLSFDKYGDGQFVQLACVSDKEDRFRAPPVVRAVILGKLLAVRHVNRGNHVEVVLLYEGIYKLVGR